MKINSILGVSLVLMVVSLVSSPVDGNKAAVAKKGLKFVGDALKNDAVGKLAGKVTSALGGVAAAGYNKAAELQKQLDYFNKNKYKNMKPPSNQPMGRLGRR